MNKKVSLLALIPILFFAVSGGPFGLEEIVSSVGPFYSLLIILLLPLIWSIPEAYVVAELTRLYPVQGGYYKWVRFGLGEFWGFMEGWWSILYTLLDLSLYPVLVTTYLKLLLPDLDFWQMYLVQLIVIWSCAIVNILGIKVVSKVLSFLQMFIFVIFIIFIVKGFFYLNFDFTPALHIPNNLTGKDLLLGLSLAFWNHIGLDGPSTVLGEIDNPKKNMMKGLFILVPLMAASYFFPILIGVCVHKDYSLWNFGEYTTVSNMMGLNWLGVGMIYGGMIAFLGLFNSLILVSTRIFSTMADDKLLPQFFKKLNPKTKAPQNAIIFVSLIYSLLVLVGFHKLVIYDVFLFLVAMLLEVIALVALYIVKPSRMNDSVIPGGKIGIGIISLMVFLCVVLMLVLNLCYLTPSEAIISVALMFSGLPFYYFLKKKSN